MCWNKTVSINTFIFSTFAVCFAYFNNIITIFQGLLLLCISSMQLIEYFLWSNITDKRKNVFYSRVAVVALALQPLFSLLTLTNPILKYSTITLYVLFLIASQRISIFMDSNPFKTSIGNNGHLRWHWLSDNPFQIAVYMIGLFLPLLFWKHKIIFIIFLVTLLATFVLYSNDKTWGSLWCWSANLISLYLIYCVFAKEFCKV